MRPIKSNYFFNTICLGQAQGKYSTIKTLAKTMLEYAKLYFSHQHPHIDVSNCVGGN